MGQHADRATPPTIQRRREWGRRSVTAVGVLVGSLVLVVVASVWSIDRSIERVDVSGLGEVPESDAESSRGDGAEASEAEALTVLVLGSDSREDLTPEQRRELGTGDAPGERTEVIALTRLAPHAEEVRMLNVPRDSVVERCDGSRGRINAAYEIGEADGRGGATCTVETLTALTGVTIDHVVMVDFGGFVDVIDQLGGVSMHLEEPLRDDGSHLDLPAGCVDLDGRDALAFVRARQLDDDYGRIARQHRLIAEVRAELAELGVFDDLPQLLRVANTIARSVELDSSLDLMRLQQLVREHRDTVAGDLEGRALPGEPTTIGRAEVLELDEAAIPGMVSWLLHGDAEAELSTVDDGADGGDVGDETEERSGGEEPTADEDVDPSNGPQTLSGQAPAGTADGDVGGDC